MGDRQGDPMSYADRELARMTQHYTEYDGRGGDDPCSHCGGTELGHPSILRTCPRKHATDAQD